SGIRCGSSMHTFANHIHSAFRCHPDLTYCNYLLVIGFNLAVSGGVVMNLAWRDAAKRGMKTVVVDPVLTATAARSEEWIPIKPSTDLALLLSLIHVIIHEIGRIDEEFLKTMTNSPYLVGQDGNFARDRSTGKVLVWDTDAGAAKPFDDPSVKDTALEGTFTCGNEGCKPVYQVLKEHVAEYTPEWASKITEVPASTIRKIAGEYVDHASIGSTIKLNGTVFPFRPVHIIIGRPVEASMNCYQAVIASHILAALVGCLEVPGGHGGGTVQPTYLDLGLNPGDDGMINMHSDDYSWPPVSYDGAEIFTPFGLHRTRPHLAGLGRPGHLAWLNLTHPPKNFPMPPAPEAYIRWRSNPLLSIGDPAPVYDVLTAMPFLLSISYVHDEVTELSDIVLPDHTEMERFELLPTTRAPGVARRYKQIALRQPVVEPLHDTRDISDILTELAARMGFLAEYNETVNTLSGLIEPYKLEKSKKYNWIEIVDRQCKSVTKGSHDLEWFKKNGAITIPMKAEDIYGVHLHMKRSGMRYPIPYMEKVKRKGDDLIKHLAEHEIDWWPTNAYTALPTYIPCVLEEVPPEYDMFVVTSRLIEFNLGKNIELPWLLELTEHMGDQPEIVLNTATAAAKNIKDGDMVWLESPVGKIKGSVITREGIRPDTILIPGQFGNWAMPLASKTGWVNQSALTTIDYKWTDPVTGSIQGNVVKARIYRAGGA
ncbi:MAG: molybdopterin-dependent oxidoreductase, partial [Dehalococcoidia bacterium]|nr:molybdopterin-dependent oxidoreductase [Dehalococcoidia bacterium]